MFLANLRIGGETLDFLLWWSPGQVWEHLVHDNRVALPHHTLLRVPALFMAGGLAGGLALPICEAARRVPPFSNINTLTACIPFLGVRLLVRIVMHVSAVGVGMLAAVAVCAAILMLAWVLLGLVAVVMALAVVGTAAGMGSS